MTLSLQAPQKHPLPPSRPPPRPFSPPISICNNPGLQWHDYTVPVLASVGSVLVGGLAVVCISSKTEPLGAWLSSLNKKNSSNDSGRLSSSPARRVEVATGTARQGEQDLSPSVYRSPPAVDEPAAAADRGQTLVGTTTLPLEPGVFSTPAAVAVSPTLYGGDAGRQGDAGSVRRGDRALLTMVLAFSLVFAYLSSLVGSSDLLGCFLGGLAFSGVPGVQTIWARQVIGRACLEKRVLWVRL